MKRSLDLPFGYNLEEENILKALMHLAKHKHTKQINILGD
jgi:hypothetical protein